MKHTTFPAAVRPGALTPAQRALRLAAVALVLAVLTACGGVQIKPDPTLPDPVMEPLPATVGLVIPPETRNFVHQETRWGVGWKVQLGEGHSKLVTRFFKSMFSNVSELADLDAARSARGLKAVFEPRIEQYSFVTARETGGRYYAVTIRYRINLYTPQAVLADSYTLTGYGNALAKGMSSGRPLQQATLAAMRDAAAKFLVQFPDQPAGKQLAKNEAVQVERAAASGGIDEIEAVPINERGEPTTPAPAPTATAPPPPAPVPEPASEEQEAGAPPRG